jgi:hypothetical protein
MQKFLKSLLVAAIAGAANAATQTDPFSKAGVQTMAVSAVISVIAYLKNPGPTTVAEVTKTTTVTATKE